MSELIRPVPGDQQILHIDGMNYLKVCLFNPNTKELIPTYVPAVEPAALPQTTQQLPDGFLGPWTEYDLETSIQQTEAWLKFLRGRLNTVTYVRYGKSTSLALVPAYKRWNQSNKLAIDHAVEAIKQIWTR